MATGSVGDVADGRLLEFFVAFDGGDSVVRRAMSRWAAPPT
jgi:hypothetical protein